MRTLFIIAGLISEVLLFLFIQILLRKQNSLKRAILRIFMTAFFGIMANVIIAGSQISIVNNFAFALYFSSIDFITYFLLLYAFEYTNRPRFEEIFRKGWRIVAIIDSANLFISVFTGHMFTMYSMTLPDGTTAYQTTPTPLFNIHLGLCYIPLIFMMYLLFSSLFRSQGFYRLKYLPIIISLLAIILLNIAYMYFLLPFDWSVLFYALAGFLVFFFSLYYIPRKLMNNTLQLAVDSMKEGILLFDTEKNIIYINKRAHDLFDLSADTFSYEDYPISVWMQNKDRKNPIEFVENFPMNIKGEEMIIKVDYRKCVNARGQLMGSFFVFEDVTPDHRLMEKLEEARSEANRANEAKSIFLANMSHEIRTPINSILGMNEMILREASNEQIIEYARDIASSGDTLMSLINNILDFSRIEAGKVEITPSDYDMFKMLRECYHLVAPRAQQKDLPIRIACTDNIPKTLFGDSQRIKQILVNLLTNSIKYTQEGMIRLTVSWEELSPNEGIATFVVSDTGQGISEENINKLFFIFQRVDMEKNRNIEGTGLGLAISRHLATMMDGDITVKSVLQKGSDFTLKLPQKITDNEPLGEFTLQEVSYRDHTEYTESFHAPSASILAVDDIDLNLKLICALLKKTGIRIVTASDGEAAINLCANEDFDLILMDHMMPDPDGYETMKAIRSAGGHNAKIPVIVLTANAIEGAREEYLKMGFDGYLSKPVTGRDLEEMLIRHLPADKVEK